ncbi:MAG: hemolysin family protein [Candidatus Nanopelagicales bacterium]|nr:hemolysin family protein [Candidatus Nanopelagicales bacterium]
MNDLWVNVVVVLGFILIGGFFAAAELALVTLRDSQVARLGEQGRRGRRLAILTADPNRFLAAGQVGLTLAGFISAGFGASKIAPVVTTALVDRGMSQSVADPLAFILVTIIIVFFSLVLGELVPKRIALKRVEGVALFVAAPIDILAKVFRPFIFALSVATDAVVRLFGIDPHEAKDQISGEELRDLVAAHEDLTEQERELIDDVFSAGERELREVMVPRTEVEFLSASLAVSKAVRQIADQPHSRYPVTGDSADDIIGFVHIRDILAPDMAERSIRVGALVREIAAYPGTKGVLATLAEMRRRHQHLAVVVDEYGGTAGIVTMEDLVEELVGDIQDEYDVEQSGETTRRFGVLMVDGLMNVDDFADECGIELPEGPYETIAGFVIASLGHLPEIDDTVTAAGHAFTVTELDGRRIARISVLPVVVDDPVLEADASLPQ